MVGGTQKRVGSGILAVQFLTSKVAKSRPPKVGNLGNLAVEISTARVPIPWVQKLAPLAPLLTSFWPRRSPIQWVQKLATLATFVQTRRNDSPAVDDTPTKG